MISRRRTLGLLATALAGATSLKLNASAAADERGIIIGTGPYGGIYYPLGNSMCRLFNLGLEAEDTRCVAVDSVGSVDNIDALRRGNIQFAIAQSDVVYQAFHGVGEFAGQPAYTDLRAVIMAHEEPFTLLTRPGTGIRGIDDLPGRRVTMGLLGSGQRLTVVTLLADLGWTDSDFGELPKMKTHEQVAALCDGRTDAMAILTGHPSGYVQEAIETCDARLVPLTGDKIERLVTQHDEYNLSSIPGAIYRNHPDPIPTFGVRAMLVTNAGLNDEIVRGMVAAILENLDILKQLHLAFDGFTPDYLAPREKWMPPHPAAQRYFMESGLLTNP